MLLPHKGSVKIVGDGANLLIKVKFKTNMEGYGVVYVMVENSIESEHEVTRRVQPLLEEFHEDFPTELPMDCHQSFHFVVIILIMMRFLPYQIKV